MKVYQQKTKVVIQQSEETFAKQRNKAGVRDKRDIRLSLR
jgi:hypothetical protein